MNDANLSFFLFRSEFGVIKFNKLRCRGLSKPSRNCVIDGVDPAAKIGSITIRLD